MQIKGICILDEVYIRFEVFVHHRYRLQNIHVYHYLLKERTPGILDIVVFLNRNIIYTKDFYTSHIHLISSGLILLNISEQISLHKELRATHLHISPIS